VSTQARWSPEAGSTAAQVTLNEDTWPVDIDIEAGGKGTHPSPHDLLDAALAACTTLTLQLYTKHKGWSAGTITVAVKHERQADGTLLFKRSVHVSGPVSDEQRASLLRIANSCPVHKSLSGKLAVETAEVQAG
jgi:putative redox protein